MRIRANYTGHESNHQPSGCGVWVGLTKCKVDVDEERSFTRHMARQGGHSEGDGMRAQKEVSVQVSGVTPTLTGPCPNRGTAFRFRSASDQPLLLVAATHRVCRSSSALPSRYVSLCASLHAHSSSQKQKFFFHVHVRFRFVKF